jgi:hypothetical protein
MITLIEILCRTKPAMLMPSRIAPAKRHALLRRAEKNVERLSFRFDRSAVRPE